MKGSDCGFGHRPCPPAWAEILSSKLPKKQDRILQRLSQCCICSGRWHLAEEPVHGQDQDFLEESQDLQPTSRSYNANCDGSQLHEGSPPVQAAVPPTRRRCRIADVVHNRALRHRRHSNWVLVQTTYCIGCMLMYKRTSFASS